MNLVYYSHPQSADHIGLLASEPLHWLFPLSANTLPPESHMAPSFSSKSLFKCHFLNERYPDNPNEKAPHPLPREFLITLILLHYPADAMEPDS